MLSLPFLTNEQLDKPHHYTQNVYEIFILLINVQSGVSTILTTFEKISILSSPPYTLLTAFRILNMIDDCDYSKTLACSDRQFLPYHNPSFTKFIKYLVNLWLKTVPGLKAVFIRISRIF